MKTAPIAEVFDSNMICPTCDMPISEHIDGICPPESVFVFCSPCYDHFLAHMKDSGLLEPGESWEAEYNWKVKICPSNSEECAFEEDGCEGCGKSHARILSESIPDNPCDSDFMKRIST